MSRTTSLPVSQHSALSEFLCSPQRPNGTLDPEALEGFLFAVSCSPVIVAAKDWIDQVFDEQPAGYASSDEQNDVAMWLSEVYEQIRGLAAQKKYTLPASCVLATVISESFTAQSALCRWSHGFMLAHSWLEEAWADLPAEVDEEIGEAIMTLGFFANEALARDYHADYGEPGESFEQMARALYQDFPMALMTYAYVGQIMRDGE